MLFAGFRPLLLMSLWAAGASAQTYPGIFDLQGPGAGNGVPGVQGGKLSPHTSVLSISDFGGGTTTIPLAFVGITGNNTLTNITILPAANPTDALHFRDNNASWDESGRTGKATVDYATGGFAGILGTITYELTCTDGCNKGNGSPSPGVFNFSFAAGGTIFLPYATAHSLLPSIYPETPYPCPVSSTNSCTTAYDVNLSSNGNTVIAYDGGGGIGAPATTPTTWPFGGGVGSAQAGGGNTNFGSFTIVPPWQVSLSTFSAAATCPGSPSTCWLTVPTPTGSIAPFSNAPITVDLNAAKLAIGVYPANLALTVTPSPGAGVPSTENIPLTLMVANGAPILELSETGIQFQAVAGGEGPSLHTITLVSSGAGIAYNATASTLTGGRWLSVLQGSGSASSSTIGMIDILANPAGLAAGTYFGRVDISAPSALKTLRSVLVTLTVAATGAANPALSTAGVIFVAEQNTNPQPQVVTVSTLSSTSIAMLGNAAADNLATWLKATASAPTVQANQPIRETLSVNTKGLTPGVYTGTLYEEVTSNSVQDAAPVTLIVTPSAGIACTPTQLLPVVTSLVPDFELPAGLPIPVQAQIVDDCGNPLNAGSVQASFSTADSAVALIPLGNGQWSATWNPHVLAGGGVTIGINAQSAAGLVGTASAAGTLDANPSATMVTPGGIVNAASLVSGVPVAPGEFISIFGSNLAPSTTTSPSYPYLTTLSGTQVLLGGQPIPLEFVSPGQINALVPYGAPVNGFQELLIAQNGAYSFAETILVASANPAVFTQSQSGTGAGVIVVIKADGTEFESTAAQPASAGDALVIYCAGLGPVSPAVADGAAAPLTTLSYTVNPVTVTIGGQPAQVLFAGLAPGFAGLYQVNAVVPAGVAAGANVPVVLTSAGFSSSPVTVAVQ